MCLLSDSYLYSHCLFQFIPPSPPPTLCDFQLTPAQTCIIRLKFETCVGREIAGGHVKTFLLPYESNIKAGLWLHGPGADSRVDSGGALAEFGLSRGTQFRL